MLMRSPPATNAYRRQRLALVCELDRLRLRIALRQRASSDEVTIAGLPKSAVAKAFSIVQLLPGRIGRIARGFALGSAFFRIVQPLIRLSLQSSR
jgi:hypothetical protein